MAEAANLGPSVNKFLARITNPNLGDLTYEEARRFQQTLSGTVYDATGRPLPAGVQAELKALLASLRTDVGNAAGQVGRASDYYKAMGDFAKASRMQDWLDKYGSPVKKAAIGGAIGGVAGYLGYQGAKAVKLADLLGLGEK